MWKWMDATYRLVVEFTLVLLRDRLDIIESPQLTTVPLLIENVRKRYKSSLWRGLYGRSGNEHTRGRTWSGTGNEKRRITWDSRKKKKIGRNSVINQHMFRLSDMKSEMSLSAPHLSVSHPYFTYESSRVSYGFNLINEVRNSTIHVWRKKMPCEIQDVRCERVQFNYALTTCPRRNCTNKWQWTDGVGEQNVFGSHAAPLCVMDQRFAAKGMLVGVGTIPQSQHMRVCVCVRKIRFSRAEEM